MVFISEIYHVGPYIGNLEWRCMTLFPHIGQYWHKDVDYVSFDQGYVLSLLYAHDYEEGILGGVTAFIDACAYAQCGEVSQMTSRRLSRTIPFRSVSRTFRISEKVRLSWRCFLKSMIRLVGCLVIRMDRGRGNGGTLTKYIWYGLFIEFIHNVWSK